MWVEAGGRELGAAVLFVSSNGRSAALQFDGMLLGYMGTMPVLEIDGRFLDLFTGQPVTISPARTDLWVIYERASNEAARFVVRRWHNGIPDEELTGSAETLWEARAFIPPGLVRIPRHPKDDPVITETWT